MGNTSWPWAPGAATGVGSMPGTDFVEAVKLIFGELPGLPHLPELPERGPGADMIGRGSALLTGLAVELYAGRWRVAARPGRDLRRTLDLLDRDLDTMTEAGDGHAGPVKIQAVGPWSLAAEVDLPAGGRILRDHGATRDLAASLADGLRTHVADVRRRLPGAAVILQIDEPSLPAVLAGRIASESGLHNLRPVEPATAESELRSIVEAVGVPVVIHCCATGAPIGLMGRTGAAAVSLDLALLDHASRHDIDALGELLDGGLGLFAGAVPTSPVDVRLPPSAVDVRPPPARGVADTVATLWRRLGFPSERLGRQVVVTPACGLAGATPEYARAALGVCVEAGRRLVEYDG